MGIATLSKNHDKQVDYIIRKLNFGQKVTISQNTFGFDYKSILQDVRSKLVNSKTMYCMSTQKELGLDKYVLEIVTKLY